LVILKNKYGIPEEQLDEIFARDTLCVYCRKSMLFPYDVKNGGDSATIEHLNHRYDWDSVRDFTSKGKSVYSIIAICCGACNSSRSDLPLTKWFETSYCKIKDINPNTVSPVVSAYLQVYEAEKSL